MSGKADARAIAIQVLARVDKDDAWASRVLDAQLKRSGVDRRDAALAAEIVYGTLRVAPALDRIIATHLKKKSKLDHLARAALRVGAYQLHHLSRVPAHAAVDASVRAVRRERGPRVGGFVNAVLRKVAKTRPQAPSPPTRVELPEWLYRAVNESLGAERCRAFCETRPLPPPLDLRITAAAASSRSEIAESLRAARPSAEVHAPGALDTALRLRRAGDPRTLPGFADGAFSVQELGSQMIGALVDAQNGGRVVDACAGRGGKTAQLAEAVGPGGLVTAVELHEARLEQIPDALRREGLATSVELACVDLSVGHGGVGDHDWVLVDAPCTGIGTLHRRPEMIARLTPEDVPRMAELQTNIVNHAAHLVSPGGALVYAVCSPLGEEMSAVAALLATRDDFVLDPFEPSRNGDKDGTVRLGPWTEGCDGDMDAYQVTRIRRVQ